MFNLPGAFLGLPVFAGLYDAYPGASGAFGLRRLFSTYTGPCLDMRRASDNTVQTFGFVGNALDTASINAFLASTTGYVAKWYDQSGNGRHMVQATAANQPQYVASWRNGQPALSFTVSGQQTLAYTAGVTTGTSTHTIVCVGQTTLAGAYLAPVGYGEISCSFGIASGNYWWGGGQYLTGDSVNTAVQADLQPHITTKVAANGATNLWIDRGRAVQDSTVSYGTLSTKFRVGGYASGNYWNGYLSEVLFYPNTTVNRAGLEAVANAYWNIYSSAIVPPSTLLSTYHVFMIAGQSNAVGYGHSIDPTLDTLDPRILQWGAAGPYRNSLIAGAEPLWHPDVATTGAGIGLQNNAGLSGFAMAFARAYLASQAAGIGVILVPVAVGGTGFSNTQWNSGAATAYTGGNALFEQAITVTNKCLASVSGAVLKGVLWHQGEADITYGSSTITTDAPNYRTPFDLMVDGFRARLTGGGATLPFVCGQMVPEWITGHSPQLASIDAVHAGLPARKTYTGYWTGASGNVDSTQAVHYSAAGQRLNGAAAYAAYTRALANH